MKALRSLFIGSAVLLYAFLAIFGLLAMNYVHTHSMSSMEHCPFMQGQQSVCSMSVTEHVMAFEGTIQTTSMQLILWVPLATVIFFILFLRPPKFFASVYRPRRQSFFSMLFSQGILNPKAP